MECSFPPPPSDDQLSAALDGDAAPDVYDHVERCPACAARLRRAREAEGKLVNVLYRADCPTSQQLGDYHWGLLGQSSERYIARHLELCALCKAEVEELGVFLTADAEVPAAAPVAAPELQRPARRRWAELVAQLVPRTPGLALRGAAGGPIMAEAGGTTLVVDVQPADGSAVTVIGQVVSDDPERWNGALVELRRAGALLAAAGVDDLGSFSFANIEPGAATLRVTPEHGVAIVLPDVALTPTRG